jgi:large conductance mechanosensitive channel
LDRAPAATQQEIYMGMAQEFRDFAVKGNVVDLAVGVIIGAAFGKIVDSLVKDLIMPIVSAIFGGLDFSNKFILLGAVPNGKDGSPVALTYKALSEAGAPIFAYGNFITVAINFLILAFIIFQMVKMINRMKDQAKTEAPAAVAPATPEDVVLLREIRDSLKK